MLISKFKSQRPLLLIIMIMIALVITIPAVLLYNNFKSITEDELGKNAVTIASTVSSLIGEDFESYSKLNNTKNYSELSYDQDYYQKMLKIFRTIKSSSNIKYLYTEKKISDTQLMYILDAEPIGSDGASPIGSIDTMDDLNKMAYTQKKPIYGPLTYSPAWGNLITAYSPIINTETGEFIGLVGVDISADYLVMILFKLKVIIVLVIMMILLIAGYLTDKVLNYTRRSLEIDYMTGLYNKKYYEQELRRAVKRSEDTEESFTIAMIDIDHFKELNDQYGHQFGDDVLIKIAKVIRESTRTIDVAVRYGGDEFIILLPSSTREIALRVCNRIKLGVAALELTNEQKDSALSVTVSMGIAQWIKGASAEKMTHYADLAMYDSKSQGRNTISVFNYEA